jgi:tRNA threonylcarbamoyladenosine biosynthesis protein TsaB
MGYILSIDTATETALVCLSKNGQLVGSRVNESQKDHASFLQPAIKELLDGALVAFTDLVAVCVTNGPGSYTGLRVGMASAKGLCYALQVPLITIGTLQLMAASAMEAIQPAASQDYLFCPMIDARRAEVFTAVYNRQSEIVIAPAAVELESNTFAALMHQSPIIYTGSGADKWKNICEHQNAFFENINISPVVFSQISIQLFENQQFNNLAYAEPEYIKAVYTTQKRQVS